MFIAPEYANHLGLVLLIIIFTAMFLFYAWTIPFEFKEFSKKKIAIIQMLCVFWPIGLAIVIPCGIFYIIKNSISWFVRTTKIIFSFEKEEN